jgi:hypothetical protein
MLHCSDVTLRYAAANLDNVDQCLSIHRKRSSSPFFLTRDLAQTGARELLQGASGPRDDAFRTPRAFRPREGKISQLDRPGTPRFRGGEDEMETCILSAFPSVRVRAYKGRPREGPSEC